MAKARGEASAQPGLKSFLASRLTLAVNIAVLLALLYLFAYRNAMFSAPWDGPAVATVVLTAAAIILAAVGIGVGLLAVWGYTTLREHAANIAREEAVIAAERAVAEKFKEALTTWDLPSERGGGDEVARAYERE